MTEVIKIATRGSRLALWQSNHVASLLKARGFDAELNIIKTQGDIVQDRFLHEIGGKGLFVKELEASLAANESHIAVHSLKDLPARIPEGFSLGAILKRHIPLDVLILRPEVAKRFGKSTDPMTRDEFEALQSVTLATASLRRQSLVKEILPSSRLEPIRGNVDTRIEKLAKSEWDGIILAGASLERLGLTHLPQRFLAEDWFIPSPAQGALAIETLKGSRWEKIVADLGCAETTAHVTMEREVLARMGGDCTMPFGCYIRYDETLKATVGRAIVLNAEGHSARTCVQQPGRFNAFAPQQLTNALLSGLMAEGAKEILEDLKIKIPDLGSL